jgi:hypothetical protein
MKKNKKQATLFDVLNERPRGHQRALDLSVLTDQCKNLTTVLLSRRQPGAVLKLVSGHHARMRAHSPAAAWPCSS